MGPLACSKVPRIYRIITEIVAKKIIFILDPQG